MSNDFWFSIAIAAVVGGFWLYKKGKGAVSTIRKIQRSFKGVCLNPKSRLSDEQCKKLAVGAMYASQQGAYRNRHCRLIAQDTRGMVGYRKYGFCQEGTGLPVRKRIPVLLSFCVQGISA